MVHFPKASNYKGPKGQEEAGYWNQGGPRDGSWAPELRSTACPDPRGRICGDKYPNALLLLPLPGLLLEGKETGAAKAMGAPTPTPCRLKGSASVPRADGEGWRVDLSGKQDILAQRTRLFFTF